MTCQSSGRSPTIVIGLGPLVMPSRIRIPRPPQNRTTFTIHTPIQTICNAWTGRTSRVPRLDVGKPPTDLVLEIPRQDQNIVRPGELALDLRHPVSEALAVSHRGQSGGLLLRHRLDPCGRLTRALLGPSVGVEARREVGIVARDVPTGHGSGPLHKHAGAAQVHV